ncbi:MAG: spore coat protein [Clostridiales bacterium]|jgi:spore coat protein CotF|nr:spore coat protein [Clostridiales bacterium]
MQNGNFSDKEVLHDALTAQKGVTGLFNTFSNEVVCPNLHKVMLDILNDEHAIQFEVFNDMHGRGFYPTPAAQQDKINQTKKQYAEQALSTSNTGERHAGVNDKAFHRAAID